MTQPQAEAETNLVVGAGSIGLALAARFAAARVPVRLVTRRAEAAARLAADGLLAEDPSDGSTRPLRVASACGLARGGARDAARLWLAVRVGDVEPLGRELAELGARQPVVCLTNDVACEDALAGHGLEVIGGVWRETCTRVADNRVRFVGAGRVVVGRHPSDPDGSDTATEGAAAALRQAGIDTGVSPDISRDKWLKLCINLMSAPNALVQQPDHTAEAFVEAKCRLLEEARAVLDAAGIPTSSCDGRDRSLDEEIAFQRAALARGTSARRIPLYNQVWSTLESGAPAEADGYHRRILALAEAHGVAAPTNRRVLAILEDAVKRGRGAGCVAAAELLG